MNSDNIAKKILNEKGAKQPTEIINVPIESLRLARWDIRREDQKDEELESLKNSIQELGLFNPLSVARMRNSDKLTVMAGRRRYNAIKQLGWKQVPVSVLLEDATETDIRIIAVNENLQRSELEDVEKGFGILASFEAAGYTNQQEVIKGVKSIDNWFNQHNNNKTDWELLIHNLVMNKTTLNTRERLETSPLRSDEKFINVCRRMSLTPKYQYQLLQIVVQLDPDVLIEAQKIGLSTKKKSLLTNTKLRDHPKIQKQLVKDIASVSVDEAAYKVRQKINDLETGYISQDKEGGNYYWSGNAREVVPRNPEIENIPSVFKIVGGAHDIIRLLTGRQLTKGEYKYTNEIIDKNKELMYKIAKSDNNPRALVSMVESLEVAKYAIGEMVKILDAELEVVNNKNELSGK